MTLEIIREVRCEINLSQLPHLPKINLTHQQSHNLESCVLVTHLALPGTPLFMLAFDFYSPLLQIQ